MRCTMLLSKRQSGAVIILTTLLAGCLGVPVGNLSDADHRPIPSVRDHRGAALEYTIPSGDGYAVVLVNWSKDDAIDYLDGKSILDFVDLRNASGPAYVAAFNIQGSSLVPRAQGFSIHQGFGGIVGPAGDISSIYIIHVHADKPSRVRIFAERTFPDFNGPNRTLTAIPIQSGSDDQFSFSGTRGLLSDGAHESYNVRQNDIGTGGLVTVGAWNVTATHNVDVPSVHTDYAVGWSFVAGGGVWSSAFDVDGNVTQNQAPHAGGVAFAVVPHLESEGMVHQSVSLQVSDSSAGIDSSQLFVAATTPWDPASQGLRLNLTVKSFAFLPFVLALPDRCLSAPTSEITQCATQI